MILGSVLAAARQVLSPPLRRIVLRSIGLTIVLLLLVWAALTRALDWYLTAHPASVDHPWVNGTLSFLAGAGFLIGLAYLLPAVSAFVGGFFLDDAAAIVEGTDFPADPPGVPMTVGSSVLYGLRFAGLALAVNLLALCLIWVPVVNVGVFFAANTYLLGREYFEMAAARFRPLPEAAALRKAQRPRVLAAGAALAGLMLVPVLNLVTPVFGIALMVHVHKQASRRALLTGR